MKIGVLNSVAAGSSAAIRAGVFALSGALLLTACGGDHDSAGSASGTEASSDASAASDAAEPVIDGGEDTGKPSQSTSIGDLFPAGVGGDAEADGAGNALLAPAPAEPLPTGRLWDLPKLTALDLTIIEARKAGGLDRIGDDMVLLPISHIAPCVTAQASAMQRDGDGFAMRDVLSTGRDYIEAHQSARTVFRLETSIQAKSYDFDIEAFPLYLPNGADGYQARALKGDITLPGSNQRSGILTFDMPGPHEVRSLAPGEAEPSKGATPIAGTRGYDDWNPDCTRAPLPYGFRGGYRNVIFIEAHDMPFFLYMEPGKARDIDPLFGERRWMTVDLLVQIEGPLTIDINRAVVVPPDAGAAAGQARFHETHMVGRILGGAFYADQSRKTLITTFGAVTEDSVAGAPVASDDKRVLTGLEPPFDMWEGWQ